MAGGIESQSSVYNKGGIAIELDDDEEDSNMITGSSCPEEYENLEVVSTPK